MSRGGMRANSTATSQIPTEEPRTVRRSGTAAAASSEAVGSDSCGFSVNIQMHFLQTKHYWRRRGKLGRRQPGMPPRCEALYEMGRHRLRPRSKHCGKGFGTDDWTQCTSCSCCGYFGQYVPDKYCLKYVNDRDHGFQLLCK